MASLPNYLRPNRKRLTLSQEEVAFLLGGMGEEKGSKVSRDESFSRDPGLRAALAYELIYGKPVRELFAGLYEQVEQEVAERAKILSHRTAETLPKREKTFINLVSKLKSRKT
jgi:transcriptional regulator with XRE-family HTH domain